MTGKSPVGVDYYDAAVVRFGNGATGALSGAATLPKGRPVQIDLRIFGAEGMLLLDIERERLELRRRDGKDEVVADAARRRRLCLRGAAQRSRRHSAGAGKAENGAPGIVGQRAIEVLDAMYRSAASGRMEAV